MDQETVLIIALGVLVVLGLGGVMYWARGSNADPLINLLQSDISTIDQAKVVLDGEGIRSLVKNDTKAPVRDRESVILVRASDHARAVLALQDTNILPR